jgi:hypothetical protein
MNARLREVGFGISTELRPTKLLGFKHLTDQYEINGMSYNFAVMLGFYGMNVEYPLRSVLTKYWAHYAQQGLPQAGFVSLSFDLPECVQFRLPTCAQGSNPIFAFKSVGESDSNN